jgi:hypothetical protein
MNDPMPERKNVAIFLLLVHGFCSNFGMLEEGLLIPFFEDRMLVVVILFEVEVGWATLIDDASDMVAIDLADVG